VPREAAVVQRLFRDYVAGKSQQQLQRELNRQGIPTTRGSTWHQGTIAKILADPFYVGLLDAAADPVVSGRHDPIVDDELWQAAAAVRAAGRKNHRAGGRPAARPFLFTHGHLRCGRCGGAMVQRTGSQKTNPTTAQPWGERYERYQCLTRVRDKHRCDQPPLAREVVDQAVMHYFNSVALSVQQTRTQVMQAIARDLEAAGARREDAEREERKTLERLSRVERDYLDGGLGADAYTRFAENLTDELAGARAQLAQLREREAELAALLSDRDLNEDILVELGAINEAIVSTVRGQGSLDGVRDALRRLFSAFTLRPTGDPPSYVLEPTVRPDVIERVLTDGSFILRREGLTTDANGFAMKSSAPRSKPRTDRSRPRGPTEARSAAARRAARLRRSPCAPHAAARGPTRPAGRRRPPRGGRCGARAGAARRARRRPRAAHSRRR
jgi:hypothetical protein